MANCKPLLTPMSTSTSDSGVAAFSDPTQYRSIVGALQYDILTCPDVAFAINCACQFLHAPTEDHWSLVKRILRYLKGTSTHGLFFERLLSTTLQAYTDADWASSTIDRRSTGGSLHM
ncbi:uncharacterized mitochondrial protein AtMg00810-like [Telopea speciosissima]|uniref:uncharacterized mitochondrial protein AtMg00810-like n=1 Tax=Telopea speciosissima TaxID=54955 RepID=UPI001CC41CAB|nr:uncharacterized mitochondrial protein AtMg00810-like [Telopea speciosissima]